MQSFVHDALPARVVFGSGTIAQLRSEAERLGVHRVLVLSTPGRGEAQAREIAALLGDRSVGIHSGAVMHTPVEATEQALQMVQDLGADAVVAVGGGSTIALGKAIALRTDLPQIVIPTTYASSEMTPILGETRDGVKTTQRTLKVLPEVVIYDVDLTLSLPPAIAATSGMNAMAHAVEALYAKDRNPVTSLMAEEGIRSLAAMLCMERGCAAPVSARWGWPCTTSSVTFSAAPSTCHMRRPTRSSCHTPLPTTLRQSLVLSNASHGPWGVQTPPMACSSWRSALGPSRPCATSACRRRGSSTLSRRHWRPLTGTRAHSRRRLSAIC
jgi:hypothetical protein